MFTFDDIKSTIKFGLAGPGDQRAD